MLVGMDRRKIVSREAWLVARRKLLAEEKALSRQRDAVLAQRRELPWVKLDKDYVLAGPDGPLAAYGLVSDPELAATQAAVAAETPMGPLE